MARVSVIIPCLNAGKTLAQTLLSLQQQSDADWEAVVVDDGSTDCTRMVAVGFAHGDPRIRVMVNQGNGPSDARNFGAACARGDIIAYCDADDLWMPQKVARLIAAFDGAPEMAGCFGKVVFFDGQREGTVSDILRDQLDIPTLLGENPVCTMSNLALRRSVVEASGGMDNRMVHNEDLEFLVRLVGLGFRINGLREVLVKYRTNPTGLSSNVKAMAQSRRQVLATAARFGHRSGPFCEAVHLRYLARRALRVDSPPLQALGLGLKGVVTSPAGWFSAPRRGCLVLGATLIAPLMPRALRHTLFSR